MCVFGCFMFKSVAMAYLFTILNSLQGALIFIMHCLMSKPVSHTHTHTHTHTHALTHHTHTLTHTLTHTHTHTYIRPYIIVTWRRLEWQPVLAALRFSTLFPLFSRLFRDLNFSTFLSCLYWGSALLYLIVVIFRGLA